MLLSFKVCLSAFLMYHLQFNDSSVSYFTIKKMFKGLSRLSFLVTESILS